MQIWGGDFSNAPPIHKSLSKKIFMKKNLLFICLNLIVFISACKTANKDVKKEEVTSSVGTDKESFEDFYIKFRTDSIFQLSRIEFPLAGKPALSDVKEGGSVTNFRWEKDKWRALKLLNTKDPEIEQHFSPVGENLMIEKVMVRRMFGTEQRYQKTNGQWFLIYYADLAELVEESVEKEAKKQIQRETPPSNKEAVLELNSN